MFTAYVDHHTDKVWVGFQHSKNSVKIGIESLNWDNLKCQFLVSYHKKTCYNKDWFVSLAFWVLIQRQF